MSSSEKVYCFEIDFPEVDTQKYFDDSEENAEYRRIGKLFEKLDKSEIFRNNFYKMMGSRLLCATCDIDMGMCLLKIMPHISIDSERDMKYVEWIEKYINSDNVTVRDCQEIHNMLCLIWTTKTGHGKR